MRSLLCYAGTPCNFSPLIVHELVGGVLEPNTKMICVDMVPPFCGVFGYHVNLSSMGCRSLGRRQ